MLFDQREMEDKKSFVLVMERLGPSLAQILKTCGGKFTIGCSCLIGIQLLLALEKFHALGFVHLDLKPDNFLVATSNVKDLAGYQQLLLIDFGLAAPFLDRSKDGEHIK